jgi:hypothetical protein
MTNHPSTSWIQKAIEIGIVFALATAIGFIVSAPTAHARLLESRNAFLPGADGGWKPYRTAGEVPLETAPEDSSCRGRVPTGARTLLLEQFRYLADHSREHIASVDFAAFAKIAGVLPRESSGASAAVTDMRLHGSSRTFQLLREDTRRFGAVRSSLESMEELLALPGVKWNGQTNFGLTQMSADRLDSRPTRAVARAMIGSLRSLWLADREEVLRRCGTGHLFGDSHEALLKALSDVQSCEPGTGSKEAVQCFGRWAMLCPAYNLTLGMIVWQTSPKYFATRRASPLCAKTLKRILGPVAKSTR